MRNVISISGRHTPAYGYRRYWDYVHFAANFAFDVDDLMQAVRDQKVLTDDIITQNTNQHPSCTPDVALYLDCVKEYQRLRIAK